MSMTRQAGIILPGYNPLQVANAPTIGTATAGSSNCAAVTFTAPTCTGGSVITTYTVYANCGVLATTGAASPLTVTGLTTGSSYTFKVVATNIYGPSYPSNASNSITASLAGSQSYTTAGTYSWVAPSGVTAVSIVAVGGGGKGQYGCYPASGSGGGLGYKNNYTVVPGNSYTVVVGVGTSVCGAGNSYFVSTGVVRGGGGSRSFSGSGAAGGTFTGDGGGNGGQGSYCTTYAGGGGAGGYSGAGGRGAYGGFNGCSAPSGGGGGGGARGYGGGGVGILGQGASGAGGTNTCGFRRGGGGSNGQGGGCSSVGGLYGGGGGTCTNGGNGAVRIVWPGNTRTFPSTCVGNP